jgi:hypothetical protein
MEHPGIGSLHPVLRLLAERGHEVQLAFGAVRSLESDRELQALVRATPGITVGALPEPGDPGQAALAEEIRSGVDYLRYLEPPYRDAHALRARAARKAPAAVRSAGALALRAGPTGVAALKGSLARVERSLEPPGPVVAFLREQNPDVLVPLHLLPIGTGHADYLRAARRLGIRCVFPVRGWDNLTNKGLLRDAPDLMLVWNELQAAEAVELHGIPRERIRLTGAPSVDHWFGWQPSRTREELCGEVGLDPALPYVLYACSSGFVAPDEVGFVRAWIERLRSRGGVWDGVGFLVRPHPLNAAQWADAALDGPQVRLWPRFGEDPGADDARRNYFDSIHHSAAVVGINTTAQIEAAIVGRPVHTLLADEFRDTQQGTLHFQHLREERDGHLYVARTFDEHAAQLEESLQGRDDRVRNERFLRRFVRPLGRERSATEATVEAIEELGAAPAPRPQPGPALGPAVRLALRPLAARAGHDAERRRLRAAEKATPVRSLQATVRALARDRTGIPVIAGPWLEDEAGEQRYWIPFLRWAQRDRPRLRERLFVISRASSAAWYEDIGAGRVDAEAVDGSPESLRRAFGLGVRAFRTLDAADVAAARDELDRVPDPPLEATGV